MSPPTIGRSAAVAALVLALAACGEGSKPANQKHELAPVPVPRTQPEPAPKESYPKDANTTNPAPKETAPAPKDALPKAPSMGDPPVPADPAIAAHHEFEDAVSARLKTVDGQITELAAKVKSAAEDQRAALQKSLDDLSTRRDEAATKLDQIRTVSADKWDTAKAELDKSVAALESAAAEALK
jgi:hypothetical protein